MPGYNNVFRNGNDQNNSLVRNTLNRERTGVQIIQDLARRRPIPQTIMNDILHKRKNAAQTIHELGQYYNIEISFREEPNQYGSRMHKMSCNYGRHCLAYGEAAKKKEANSNAARSALLKIIGHEKPSAEVGDTVFDAAGNSTHNKVLSRPVDQSNTPMTMNTPGVRSDANFSGAVEQFNEKMISMKQGYHISVDDKIRPGHYWVEYSMEEEPLGSGVDTLLRNAQCLAAYASMKILDEHNKAAGNMEIDEIDEVPAPTCMLEDDDAKTIEQTIREFLIQVKAKLAETRQGNDNIPSSIAAFFVKTENGTHLVAFGAGTGIVGSRSMVRADGRTLHNCHALVLAQRALKRFLWREIINFKTNELKDRLDILEFNESTQKLALKDGVDFFLFMTKPPCGDPTDEKCDKKGLVHYVKSEAETVKKDNGGLDWGDDEEMPIYEETGPFHARPDNTLPFEIQNFQSLKLGQDFKPMSCNDKITLWNVLGYQGALINCFLEAIYMGRIIICGEVTENYLDWSTYMKFKNELASMDYKLPEDFIAVNPGYECMSEVNPFQDLCKEDETRISINWYYTTPVPEIVDHCTGSAYNSGASRLCKAAFLHYFKESCKYMPEIQSLQGMEDLSYDQVKNSNSKYQQAKNTVQEMFANSKFGKLLVHKDFGAFK